MNEIIVYATVWYDITAMSLTVMNTQIKSVKTEGEFANA